VENPLAQSLAITKGKMINNQESLYFTKADSAQKQFSITLASQAKPSLHYGFRLSRVLNQERFFLD
jgi:hypothetical protein